MRCKAAFLIMATSAVSGNPCCAFYAGQDGSQARRNVPCQRDGGGPSLGNCGRRQGGCGNGNCQGSRAPQQGCRAAAASLADNVQCPRSLGNNCGGGQGWRNGGARGRGVGGGRGNCGGGCFQDTQQGADPTVTTQQSNDADSTMTDAQRCPGNMNAAGGTPGGLTAKEHADIQFLFDNRQGIERQVNKLYDKDDGNESSNVVGVQAKTTSGNPAVVAALHRHVGAMKTHLDQGIRVRQRDPFFRAVFDNHHDMVFDPTYTENGIDVIHKGNTPCAAALADGHSQVVTGFIENGRYEAQINHDIPDICQNMRP